MPAYSSATLSCFTSNVLGAWDYSAATLAAEADDAAALATLNAFYSADDLDPQLGDETYSDSLDEVVASATAIKVTYYLKSDVEVVDNKYVSVNNDAWEYEFLALVQGYDSASFELYPAATRSFSDEFGNAIGGDIVLINLAYLCMIVYLSVNLGSLPCRGRCPNPGSRVLLALSSVAAIMLSMGAAFGLCAGLGFIWTPVHSVLPFVILGLGVDDSFVITNAFDMTSKKDTIPHRMRDALAHAATSITVTSLTDFVAFAISTSSALPALSSFCMYAAVTIAVLFALQVTFFAASLALDEERQQLRHTDCCPCCNDSCVPCCLKTPCCSPMPAADPSQDTPQGGVSKFLEQTYCPVLLSKGGMAVTLVAFAALVAVCAGLGVPNLRVEDNERSFVPDGSYLLATLDKGDEFFSDIGVKMYIVTEDVDYFAKQASLTALKADVEALSTYLVDPSEDAASYVNWYDDFTSYCATNAITAYATDEAVFYQSLHAFLQSSSGGFYNTSVVFDGARNVVATRVQTQFKVMSKFYKGKLQQDTDKVIKAMDAVRAEDWAVAPAYPWAYEFQTWETFKIIQNELFMNIVLCLVAVLIITTLLIGHPGTSGLVFFCVLLVVVDILGCMYFWGIFIDNVSVIQAVISIGLCVDYAAHVGHSFMLKAGSNEERVTAAMADIGSAVLNGGISTFLAVLFLASSQSYVFRLLFRQFFLTVALGLAHGVVLLPVLLNLFGPKCYAAVDARANAKAAEGKIEGAL